MGYFRRTSIYSPDEGIDIAQNIPIIIRTPDKPNNEQDASEDQEARNGDDAARPRSAGDEGRHHAGIGFPDGLSPGCTEHGPSQSPQYTSDN